MPAGAQRCESGADARVRPTGRTRRMQRRERNDGRPWASTTTGTAASLQSENARNTSRAVQTTGKPFLPPRPLSALLSAALTDLPRPATRSVQTRREALLSPRWRRSCSRAERTPHESCVFSIGHGIQKLLRLGCRWPFSCSDRAQLGESFRRIVGVGLGRDARLKTCRDRLGGHLRHRMREGREDARTTVRSFCEIRIRFECASEPLRLRETRPTLVPDTAKLLHSRGRVCFGLGCAVVLQRCRLGDLDCLSERESFITAIKLGEGNIGAITWKAALCVLGSQPG